MQNRPDSIRLTEIDIFRGLAIFLMVLANFMGGVRWIPAWLKHAPDIGYTVIDLIAPMFIFAIGLTYRASYLKRCQRDGQAAAAGHILLRYLALIGMGAIISSGEIQFNQNTSGINWGVLQAIGVSGLVTLLFIRLPAPARLAGGLLILVIYQYLLDRFWLQSILPAPHGGFPGSIGWSAMLILSTVLAEIYSPRGRNQPFFLSALAITLAGVLLAVFFPISKHRVSSSYVLLSLGLSALIFWVFSILPQTIKKSLHPLMVWGRNPLLLYMLHYLVLGLYVLPGIDGWFAGAPVWLTLLQGAFLILVLDVCARITANRKWFLTL
jgi:predicted acyltransferase